MRIRKSNISQRVCSKCSGTGEIRFLLFFKRDCPDCAGTGKVKANTSAYTWHSSVQEQQPFVIDTSRLHQSPQITQTDYLGKLLNKKTYTNFTFPKEEYETCRFCGGSGGVVHPFMGAGPCPQCKGKGKVPKKKNPWDKSNW